MSRRLHRANPGKIRFQFAPTKNSSNLLAVLFQFLGVFSILAGGEAAVPKRQLRPITQLNIFERRSPDRYGLVRSGPRSSIPVLRIGELALVGRNASGPA